MTECGACVVCQPLPYLVNVQYAHQRNTVPYVHMLMKDKAKEHKNAFMSVPFAMHHMASQAKSNL